MKTQQQRQQEKRKEKLDLIEQQIKEGTLKVRKMTASVSEQVPSEVARRDRQAPCGRARASRQRQVAPSLKAGRVIRAPAQSVRPAPDLGAIIALRRGVEQSGSSSGS